MLRALLSLGNPTAFEYARWAEKGNRIKYKNIKVEVVSENERRYNVIMQSFKLDVNSIVLRTNYIYDYKIADEVYYRNKWWYVKSVNNVSQDISPQALSIINSDISYQSVLELSEVS